MKKYSLRLILLILIALMATSAAVTLAAHQGIGNYEQHPISAATVWNGPHRDSRNSDFAPFVVDSVYEVKWRAITTAAVFLAPATGPEGNLYVTSGQGPGSSHLHAFDADGNLLWQAPLSTGFGSLDAGAIGSAPYIDVDGNIFVSDANQFWSFENDGTLRWVVPLPASFVSAVSLPSGEIGGVTRDGIVHLFDRLTGVQVATPLSLPGLPPVGMAPVQPAGLLEGGLLFPDLIDDVWQGFYGYGNEVSNSPAVDPYTGRMFIVGSGVNPGEDIVYGIDYVTSTNTLTLGFQTVISGFSGTSPALSTSGEQLFVSDGNGVMYGIDSSTGGINWTRPNAASAYSAAVGPDDIVYSGQENTLLAINPIDGSIAWSRNYDSFAQSLLPTIPITGTLESGVPEAKINGVVSVSSLYIHVPIVLGYDYILPPGGGGSPVILQQPQITAIVTLDPSTGDIVNWVEVDSTVNGIIAIGEFGEMYIEHTAMLSSIFHYGTIPQAAGTQPPVPIAGITALGPVSYRSQAHQGKEYAEVLTTDAITNVNSADYDTAFVQTRRALIQIQASQGSVVDARDNGELLVLQASDIVTALLSAEASLESALDLLHDQPPNFAADSLALLASANADIVLAIQLCVDANPTAIQIDYFDVVGADSRYWFAATATIVALLILATRLAMRPRRFKGS